MQKALDQMNLQLHHVISDVTGTTGLSILDSVMAGEFWHRVMPDWWSSLGAELASASSAESYSEQEDVDQQ
jgi:hypothetical protein